MKLELRRSDLVEGFFIIRGLCALHKSLRDAANFRILFCVLAVSETSPMAMTQREREEKEKQL